MTTEPPREKPYDFVPLPPEREPIIRRARGHHTVFGTPDATLLSGTLSGTLVSEAAVHIASGFVVPMSDIQVHRDIVKSSVQGDRLVAAHMRTNGRRVLPGSSLKGLLRSAVEAITTTGTTFRLTHEAETVRGVDVTAIRNKVQTQFLEPPPALPLLTLANRLFGVTDEDCGYQAHCTFEDALQSGGGGVIFRMLPRYRPQPDFSEGDPAITTGWQRYFANPKRTLPRGRKFYRSGQAREVRRPYTAVEACAAESRFQLRIQFHNLTSAEIGVLLLVLGANGEIPRLIAGGGKPLGLGAVRCTNLALQVLDPASYRDFETTTRPFPIDEAVQAARQSGEIFEAGYRVFAEIMSRPASYTAGGDERHY
jgi:hypothetical protein